MQQASLLNANHTAFTNLPPGAEGHFLLHFYAVVARLLASTLNSSLFWTAINRCWVLIYPLDYHLTRLFPGGMPLLPIGKRNHPVTCHCERW